MSSSDNIPQKKFISDEENPTKFKEYRNNNKDSIKEKLSKINCTDAPFSMSDGNLFKKLSVEYIKNIIFLKKGRKYQENIKFNFFDYIKLFTEIKHSKRQKEIFEKIKSFQDKEAKPDDYLNSGEFDLVVYNIKGEDILNALTRNKFNFYHYPGIDININKSYSLIAEIKLNFFSQIKREDTQKQFKKFKTVIELLVSEPNLDKIKAKLGLNEKNEIIFMLATNGDFYQFDYMRNSKFYSKEDYNTDIEKKYEVPFHLKFIEEISKLNIPVLLVFVPKTIDDNGTIYKNKYVLQITNENENLNNKVKNLNEKIKSMEQEKDELSNKKGYEEKESEIVDKSGKIDEKEDLENTLNILLKKKNAETIIENIFNKLLAEESTKIKIENILDHLLKNKEKKEEKEIIFLGKKKEKDENQ